MVAWSVELAFIYDYGQVYLHDAEHPWTDNYDEYADALADAQARKSSVGIVNGFVDILMRGQANFGAALSVEGSDSPPPLELDGWDHVVEFALAVPSGELVVEASGGSGEVVVPIPAGVYRARRSGKNFEAADAWERDDDAEGEDPPDAYRLHLWADECVAGPRELKQWSACLAATS